MKTTRLSKAIPNCAKRVQMEFILTIATAFASQDATATPIDLGAVAGFAVLAASGITVTGPTTITGDIGSSPTPSITGLENVTLNGVNQAGNVITVQAQNNLTTAYNNAVGI